MLLNELSLANIPRGKAMLTLTPVSQNVRMVLGAKRASDLMTSNPVSIRQDRSVAEAAALFALRGIGAAPVIDEAGRPVGVVSRTDVLHHYRLSQQRRDAWREVDDQPALQQPGTTLVVRAMAVHDLMMPVVYSVRPNASAVTVVERMLALHIRRLFVVDHHGVLVGVITAWDVLRQLEPEREDSGTGSEG
jgi:CBS domain-containing protein